MKRRRVSKLPAARPRSSSMLNPMYPRTLVQPSLTLSRVPETLPQEVLTKMHAPPKSGDTVLSNAGELEAFDAILFGIPTRYGAIDCPLMR